MSPPVITPVVPPVALQGRDWVAGVYGSLPLSRRPLPLPPLIAHRTTTHVYGLAALDDRGRLADRTITRALGWAPGLRLDIGEATGLLIVQTDPDGAFQVTCHGHLRLPAPLRHRCGLRTGDRVLLAADPGQHRLVIYPPAALDALLTAPQHVSLVDGEPV